MIIYLVFISLIIGSYSLTKPLISIIMGFLLIVYLIRKKDVKITKICLFFIFLSFFRLILYRLNIFLPYGIVVRTSENYILLYNGLSKFYVPLNNHSLNVFDVISLNGEVKDYAFNTYESCFDFNSYLESELIYKMIDISSYELVFPNIININMIRDTFLNKFTIESKVVLSELLFNTSYDDNYSKFISETNLSYLLSLSSLHLYFLTYLIRSLLEMKIKEENVDIMILGFYLLVLILTSYKTSILRYLIYQFINVVLKRKKIEINYLKKSILSLSIISIIDFSYLYSLSFIYNLMIPIVLTLTKDGLSLFKKKTRNFLRILIIQITIIFINIVINESFSLIGPIITPFFTLIILILLIISGISFILPLYNIINIISRGIINAFSFIDSINIVIYINKYHYFFLVLFVLLFLLIILSLENKDKFSKNLFSILFVINILIVKLPISESFQYGVYFINVGQGDSILIHDRRMNVLIDTGGIVSKDIANDCLIPFLKKHNIYYLDYVFITHQDYDHMGAFEELKTNFKILDFNENNNFTYININKFEFYNLNPSIKNTENDDSLVLFFNFYGTSYLCLGDVSKDVDEKIALKHSLLDVDVLKVSHHGASSSTSEKLLNTFDIKTAIISCAKNNIYGHPHYQTLKNLEKNNIEVRRTDQEGTIFLKKQKNILKK